MSSSVYPFGKNLYLNLTQRCPTACTFCFKERSGRRFRGRDLALGEEPSTAQVWAAVLEAAARGSYPEFVFCGYGESTYRLETLRELCLKLKEAYPGSRRRLNTVGLGSAIWKRDITPDLDRLDNVSVSLNTADPAQWLRLHRPLPELRPAGFEAVVSFIDRCVKSGLDTTVTAVALPGVDLDAVARLAASMGAHFRLRPTLAEEDL